MKEKFWYRPLVVLGLLLAVLAFAGCEGDDGKDGKDGQDGASAYELAGGDAVWGSEDAWLDSLQGGGAPVVPIESCVVCHGDGAIVGADAVHAGSGGSLDVNDLEFGEDEGGNLVASFSVRYNGANKSDYTEITRAYRLNGETMERETLLEEDNPTLTSETEGRGSSAVTTYTITFAPGETDLDIDSRYLFRLEDGTDGAARRVIVMFDYPFAPVEDVLGMTSCADCHGDTGNGFHYGYPSNGGKNCVVCHDAENTNYPRLAYMVHGIHSSANMPTGDFELFSRDGEDSWNYSIHFPTYMNNCSICHSTEDGLEDVNEMPVQGLVEEGSVLVGCFTCHQSMDSFDFEAGLTFHENYTDTTNCQQCHNDSEDGIARYAVAQFHNGSTTERAGLIWDGADQSVVEGARIDHQITGVTRTGDTLAITWGATVDGKAVDPCNTTPGTSAPTFNSGYSVLKAFFQGGDLVNADNGNGSPGQPNNTSLSFGEGGNTACVGNVATTTITLTADEAALTGNGRVALQGKPNILFAPESAPAPTSIQTRAKSPTYDFELATGDAADARRPIADSSQCLKCHVGSLYQHGGNRVDNVELCVMCHNEASSEQNVRIGYGVDASEAYDGKVGQTYGFKSMLHAIHASGGATSAPIVIYRGRGIYAFAPSRDLLPNWPGEGTQIIYGSDPPTEQTHNFVTAHYPNNLNDCSACHFSNFSAIPDQTQAVATTVDAGMAPWDNQLDDVLEGPAAAACMSCHTSNDSSTNKSLKAHAYQNGWYPTTFEEGRQTVLDAAE